MFLIGVCVVIIAMFQVVNFLTVSSINTKLDMMIFGEQKGDK